MVGTLPKGFISKNHWGLDRKLTLMVSYLKSTILFVCKSRILLQKYELTEYFWPLKPKVCVEQKDKTSYWGRTPCQNQRLDTPMKRLNVLTTTPFFKPKYALLTSELYWCNNKHHVGSLPVSFREFKAFDRSCTICNFRCFCLNFFKEWICLFSDFDNTYHFWLNQHEFLCFPFLLIPDVIQKSFRHIHKCQ